MRRVISFFILLMFLLSFNSCNKNNSFKSSTYGVFKENSISNGSVHLLLYFPDKNGKYLVPEDRAAKIDKYIEKTISEEFMKGPANNNEAWPLKDVKVISVSGRGNVLTVNLSGNFIELLSRYKEKVEITVYALINSLTELPGIKEVRLEADGRGLMTAHGVDLSHPLKRERKYFNRDKSLSPSEVLKREMTFEKEGKWLDSYLLMSDDENNPYRKYYEAYIEEMQDMKDRGFLDTEFTVGGYKIDPSGRKARVEVVFSGNNVKNYFNTVLIDGVWMVDWLTKQ